MLRRSKLLAIYAIYDVFRVSIASSKHEGELGEFETVMQTRDTVKGLHPCREFSQLPRVDEAMETRKKVLYCSYKIFVKDNSTIEGNK